MKVSGRRSDAPVADYREREKFGVER